MIFKQHPVPAATILRYIHIEPTTKSKPATDAIEEDVVSNSGLQNLGDGYYQWNWKSPKAYANTYKTLRLDRGEGASFGHLALFQFRK